MEKKDLGLKSLANVLLRETEALKRANAEIKDVVPEVKKCLAEVRHYSMKIVEKGETIQKMKVQVDQSSIEEVLKGKQIVKKWPDVEFVTSAELGRIVSSGA